MLHFSVKETRLLVGEITTEEAFSAALLLFPEGVRAYLCRGARLSARMERMGAVRLLLNLLDEGGFSSEALKIIVEKSGRPRFEDAALPDFNLSHSGGYVAAVIGEGRVGIDLQEENLSFDPLPLAARFFGMDEVLRIEKAPAMERNELFFRLWTQKEAVGKALGGGLSTTLRGNFEKPAFLHTERLEMGGKGFCLSVCRV